MSNRTVKHLKAEHERIEAVLAAFEHFLETGMENSDTDHHELAALVDCLTESLMLIHEEKEETIVLPELARHGLSWSDGTLAGVRRDHRHGRYLLRSLRQGARQKRAWSPDDRRHVAAIGREWVSFNRQHMAQEEAQLFPFLDTSLDDKGDAAIAEQFEHLDEEFDEMSDSERLKTTLDEFVAKFSP